MIVVALCPSAALAAEPPAPNPDALWREFPLDDSRSPTPPPRAQTPREQRQDAKPSGEAVPSRDAVEIAGLTAVTLATAFGLVFATLAFAAVGRDRRAMRKVRAVAASAVSALLRRRAQPRARQSVNGSRERDEATARGSQASASDVEALKEKLRARPAKKSPSDDEREILRAKRETGSTPKPASAEDLDALKTKLERATKPSRPRKREPADVAEAEALRAKLARHVGGTPDTADSGATTPRTPRPPRRASRAPGRAGRDPARVALVATLPETGERAKKPTTPRARCRVALWRGYVKSQFYAVEESRAGPQRVVSVSPLFRWRGDEAPTQRGAPAAAFAALIDTLERDGWSIVEVGSNWFDVELERPEDPPLWGLPEP